MPHARTQHPSAVASAEAFRRRMVACRARLTAGRSGEATADRSVQIDRSKTDRASEQRCRGRCARFERSTPELQDRSSRPSFAQPDLELRCVKRVLHLRRKRRWEQTVIVARGATRAVDGAWRSSETLPAAVAGVDRGEPSRPSPEPVVIATGLTRTAHSTGELIHVRDRQAILGAIPASTGGGWRLHAGAGRAATGGHAGVGYRFIHTAIDDRTRLAYSEILDDEQAVTAAEFWIRAERWLRRTWGALRAG